MGEVRVHGLEEAEAALVGSFLRQRNSQSQSRLTALVSSLRAEIQMPGVGYLSLIYCFSFVLFTPLPAFL